MSLRPLVVRAALVAVCTLGWYVSSVSIVLMNRWAFSAREGTARISPTLVTACHMIVKAALGLLVVFTPLGRPASTSPSAAPSGGCCGRGRARLAAQQVSWHVLWWTVMPMASLTAFDIILSNFALKLVDVSVYTVVKSTGLLWTFLISVALRLLPLTSPLVLSIATLLLGVGLCTYRPGANVNATGALCAAGAALCASIRWIVTQQYFSRPGVPKDVLAMLAFLGPCAVISMAGPLLADREAMLAYVTAMGPEDGRVLASLALVGGSLAFLLVLFELQLLAMTSALSLNVIGHTKDALVIVLGVIVFHEQLSGDNWLGVALALVGTAAYARLKRAPAAPPVLPFTSADGVVAPPSAAPKAGEEAEDDIFGQVRSPPRGMGMSRAGPEPSSLQALGAAVARALNWEGATPASGGRSRGMTPHEGLEGDESELDTTGWGRVAGSQGREVIPPCEAEEEAAALLPASRLVRLDKRTEGPGGSGGPAGLLDFSPDVKASLWTTSRGEGR
jgi:solute carrier family 35 protein C2